uniref:Tyrosine-protein phosphatase non-receptor type substrate 1-like n=1 Tax=Lepisosteus oculatus TaxID=7918 RepID=W5M2N2_LEPOC|nr:PREDICTED: tyrosine-protein phosphatase non-receptor type substrate 1-like [Lepisosteus oculatus]XP_015192953.1 PREDICTED: tyrosine-protein phosphatase non-receptor type substrate 1-like [Lepisosteus oculatus]
MAYFSCVSKGFYPGNVTVKWFHNGSPVVGTDPQRSVWTSNDGTFVSISNMTIRLLASHHGSVVACHVFHMSASQPVVDNITLNVNYGPLAIKVFHLRADSAGSTELPVLSSVIRTNANSHLELLCKADSNPASEVDWAREGSDLSWHQIPSLDGQLSLNNLKERNAGVYWCSVSNSYGKTNISVRVVVERPGEYNWLKGLAAGAVTVATVLLVVAVYFCLNTRRKWKGQPSIVISERVESNEGITEDQCKEAAEYAMICRSPVSKEDATDSLSVNEVPYADILISVRGTSTPELRHIPRLTIGDGGQEWGDEEPAGSPLQSSRSVDRLPVHHLEATRKLSSSSEYAVIIYPSKPRS